MEILRGEWAAAVLWAHIREPCPLGWWKDHWDRQKGCGEPGLHLWGVSALLAPEAGWREVCPHGCGLPVTISLCTLVQVKKMLWLCLFHIAPWHWTWSSRVWGRDPAVGCRGDPVPGWSLSGGGGHGWCSANGRPRSCPGLWEQPLQHSRPPVSAKNPRRPCHWAVWHASRVGGRGWGSDQLWATKRTRSWGCVWALPRGLHRQPTDVSLHTQPTCLNTSFLWGKGPGAGKQRNTLKRSRARGFPGRRAVKNCPVNAGDVGSTPGPGRFHMSQSDSPYTITAEPTLYSPTATTTKPSCRKERSLEPVLCIEKSHCNEKPKHRNKEQTLLAATRESLHTATKTQHTKNKSISLKRKGTEPARTWPSGLLLQQLGIRPCPERALTLTKQGGSPTTQLAPALAPPSLPPPSPREGLPGQPEEEHGWCHQIKYPPTNGDGHMRFV